MFLTSLFLILLVLVQRGRGGGLAGAFGGMGGQSAFGTKAGDLFTRITIGVAGGWILLCICAILVLNRQTSVFGSGGAPGGAFPGAGLDGGSEQSTESPSSANGDGLDTGGTTQSAEDAEGSDTSADDSSE